MSSGESAWKLASSYTPEASGNWYSPCGKQFDVTFRKPSKCSQTVAPLLLGVYLKIIIKKKGKAIHEGVLGVLFSNGENCNCIN